MTPSGTINRIALLFAMDAEGTPVADALALSDPEPLHPASPARIRRGMVGDVDVVHCLHGTDPTHGVDRIGTEAAALTSWLLLEHVQPDLLVNAGTCGGFEARGGAIGDVIVARSAVLYHDHRVPLEGFAQHGEGRFVPLEAAAAARLLGAASGPISSGSSIDVTPDELAFFTREGVLAKDMEAAAIASVCRDLGVPVMHVKAVTDLVDHPEPAHEVFLRNLASTTEVLCDRMVQLVRWIGEGRSLSDCER